MGTKFLRNLIISMRPYQWTKNAFVLMPFIFSDKVGDAMAVGKIVATFSIFCFLSGAVYIINDSRDKDEDRKHAVKSTRPIASGKLDPRPAVFAAIIITFLCLVFSFGIEISLGTISLGYFLLTLGYTFFLKKAVILDVFTVSLGFVLRLIAGGMAIDIVTTPWSIIVTFFLALMISLGKRRSEILSLQVPTIHNRQLIKGYSLNFINPLIFISSALVIISYSLFTFTSGKDVTLIYTTLFVIYGVFRYLYLLFEKDVGEFPERLVVLDKPLIANGLGWAIMCYLILNYV